MDAISQTTFRSAFSWMKMFEFRLKFHWSLFLRVQLTIFRHRFRKWLGAVQATSHYLNQWWLDYRRIYASLGLNELNSTLVLLPSVVIVACHLVIILGTAFPIPYRSYRITLQLKNRVLVAGNSWSDSVSVVIILMPECPVGQVIHVMWYHWYYEYMF